MICSASDFSSSGLSGALSSASSSPFTRIVAGRPTFKSRSDALRWTMSVMAALKLKVGWPLWGASGMGVDSEKGLSELDGLGVLHQHLPDHARHLGLDLVHDLHRLDDAHHLPRRHATARLDIGLGARLRSGVKRPHHGRLDLEQLRRAPAPPLGADRRRSSGGRPWSAAPPTRTRTNPGGPRSLPARAHPSGSAPAGRCARGSWVKSNSTSTRSVTPSDNSSAVPPSDGR